MSLYDQLQEAKPTPPQAPVCPKFASSPVAPRTAAEAQSPCCQYLPPPLPFPPYTSSTPPHLDVLGHPSPCGKCCPHCFFRYVVLAPCPKVRPQLRLLRHVTPLRRQHRQTLAALPDTDSLSGMLQGRVWFHPGTWYLLMGCRTCLHHHLLAVIPFESLRCQHVQLHFEPSELSAATLACSFPHIPFESSTHRCPPRLREFEPPHSWVQGSLVHSARCRSYSPAKPRSHLAL